ncbi:putative gag-pol polyprotein [Panicum miliaceum]|uniref:Gag-pol polyprotein n=1 Tax=Panicum miliaceum TaxID=4540 RepID=A0A3L6RUM6_PANMI|nr:putative gag-pol polyprotein [Panicum miliaceum]
MKIDQHPFLANMVDTGGNSRQTKVLTSESARRGGAVDPRRQVTMEEIKRNRRGPERPRKPITSQFLLNKYRQQQEESRYHDEMIRRHEDHWQCPFFIHCWESNIRLPSADNCPECNGLSCNDRPMPHSRDRGSEPISRNRRGREEQRVSVHDWLGGRVDQYHRSKGRTNQQDGLGGRICVHDGLEEMADDRVSDEDPLGREPDREYSRSSAKPVNPRWCPDGLSRSKNEGSNAYASGSIKRKNRGRCQRKEMLSLGCGAQRKTIKKQTIKNRQLKSTWCSYCRWNSWRLTIETEQQE